MTKAYKSLVILLVVCASGSLMSMQQDKGRLNFLVDSDILIKGYSAQNMDFFLKPKDFLGKNLFDVVPLNATDRNRVAAGFIVAQRDKQTIGVGYTLEQKEFVAKITALKTGKDTYNYFVKVQESKK